MLNKGGPMELANMLSMMKKADDASDENALAELRNDRFVNDRTPLRV
jgi:hypothetical protein